MLVWFLKVKNFNLLSRNLVSSAGAVLRVGNVSKELGPSPAPHLVPTSHDVSNLPQSQLEHIRWLLQKDVAKQDVYLIGDPGPTRRRLAGLYCQLANREVEHLVISRDTTESDIKQRREIVNGSSVFSSGPAVRAATQGRTLVIEGIERAEQNILPILNNLLENREMQLEDGRFLVAPSRYDTFIDPGSDMVRVSPEFWVIALGLPVPPYRGYPLDPPLRSRFQARRVRDLPYNEHYSALLAEGVPESSTKSILSFTSLFQQGTTRAWPFLNSSVADGLGQLVRDIPNTPINNLISRVYPHELLLPSDSIREYERVLSDIGIRGNRSNDVLCNVLEVGDGTASVRYGAHTFTVKAGRQLVGGQSPGGQLPGGPSSYVTTNTQERLISDMMLSHKTSDICLIGPPGCGKSLVISEFARRLGYSSETVTVYSDMTSRDLLQQRHTNTRGDTVWRDSPLVTAALEGHLFILDGYHKLDETVMTSLSGLCEDRMVQLPDGTRLTSHHADIADKLGVAGEELVSRGVRPIHPSFRIMAVGDAVVPGLVGSWNFHHHPDLEIKEQISIINNLCAGVSKDTIHKLHKLKETLTTDTSMISVDMLSLRRLVSIARDVGSGGDLGEAINTSLLTRFMPPLTRTSLTSTLKTLDIAELPDARDVSVTSSDTTLTIGRVSAPKQGGETQLIPKTLFYDNNKQTLLLESLLRSYTSGSHVLLVGNQGVGKNKLVDRLLELLEASREYVQLHRDSTVQSITVQPSISNGRVEYLDSPLIRAVKHGRVLVVDEADKAPTAVTSALRTLLDTTSMWLPDGRKIVPPGTQDPKPNEIVCSSGFRMMFLANRPGFPFLGNDFYSVMGDLLRCHPIDNPDPSSELQLLKRYGPGVREDVLVKLISAFSELREMSDTGAILYPYSTRELVNIVKHFQEFPEDGVTGALCNVLDFEQQEGQFWDLILSILHKHDIPYGAKPRNDSAHRFALKTENVGHLSLKYGGQSTSKARKGYFTKRGPFYLPQYTVDVPVVSERARSFSEHVSTILLPKTKNNTKYTHLVPGGDMLHMISTKPDILYTITDTDSPVSCLEIGGALSFTPKLSAAAYNEQVIIADQSRDTLLQVDTTKRVIYRLDLYRFLSHYRAGGYTVYQGLGPSCWVTSSDLLIKYDVETHKTLEWEMPFPISDVIQGPDPDSLVVKSHEQCFMVELSNKTARYTPVEHPTIQPNNWLVDKCADWSDNVVEAAGDVILAKECLTHLKNKDPVDLTLLKTKITESGQGLLHKGLYTTPVRTIPQEYRQTDKQTTDHEQGYLAVVDCGKHTVSFIPLQLPANESKPYGINFDNPLNLMTTLKSPDKIFTLSAGGVLQNWEVSADSLSVSYKTWREMVGNPPKQLNLERNSGLDVSHPKHGKVDPENTPHVGGNTWAGGTGGRDTAGLGGKGGPYRLDAGHDVHQLSDEEKNSVPEEVQRAAREMGKREFQKRLKEIQMSEYDSERYDSFVKGVSQQIASLKQMAAGLEAKQGDRVWLRNQTDGELDDSKIIEGLTGERNIYKRRGVPQEKGMVMRKPKHLTLLVDVSGSMYRFNGLDQRLQRELELTAMVMEGLRGSEDRVKYDVIGHSGENSHITFVSRDLAPQNEKKRLQVLEEMLAHSQFCWTGDNTIAGLNQAIIHADSIEADEKIVIAFSDANLKRYFINPSNISSIMTRNKSVSVFMIFIGSLGDEAEGLRKVLPPGKSFVTMDTKEMPTILQQIFTSTMMKD